MSATATPDHHPSLDEALEALVITAVDSVPGVSLASISLREGDRSVRTVAATDYLARDIDEIQYALREGPCYAAVTDEPFALVNDLSNAKEFPRYAPKAHSLGINAQAAIQLVNNGQRVGLNLYARKTGVFGDATVRLAEHYSTPVAALLGYADQVEHLSEALHTRTDIGIAVGVLMERFRVDRNQAFSYLVRHSQDRNLKVRILAQQIINRTFEH